MIRAYLDNNATTRLAPEALEAMTPYLTDRFLNPSSAAGQILDQGDPGLDARRAIARLLGDVDLAAQVVLTSGASEANSWVLSTACAGDELYVSATEHPSILAAARAAEARGSRILWLPVTPEGVCDLEALTARLQPEAKLVCLMAANNETGVLQPVDEAAQIIRALAPNALIHVDATQALGRCPVGLGQADTLSLSAHKLHGPKGIGALVMRPGLNLRPLIHGEQDDGRRGGTINAPAAAGLAEAARLALEGLDRMGETGAMRDRFEALLKATLPGVRVNGAGAPRLPNTSSFIIPGLDAVDAVDRLALDGVVVANGSACSSGSPAPSHVLTAMGLTYAEARSTLRVSLSRETRWPELALAAEAIADLAREHARTAAFG